MTSRLLVLLSLLCALLSTRSALADEREPRFDELYVGRGLRVELLRYDDAALARLARDPRVRFQPIERVLAEAALDLQAMSCPDARATVASLSAFYAGHDAALAPLRGTLARCQ